MKKELEVQYGYNEVDKFWLKLEPIGDGVFKVTNLQSGESINEDGVLIAAHGIIPKTKEQWLKSLN